MLSQIIDEAEGRKPSRRARLISYLLLIVLGGWVLNSFLNREGLGGMSASYPAVDHDPRLTKEAQLARPILTAIQKYRTAHEGHVPPTLDHIQADLATEKDLPRFHYTAEGSNHYRLQLKLGWDPSLIYEDTATGGHWTFDPGDGRPQKPLKLDP